MSSICDQIVGRYPSGRLFVAGLASNGLGFSVLYLLQDIPPTTAGGGNYGILEKIVNNGNLVLAYVVKSRIR